MTLASTLDIIAELKAGRMVILVDDREREARRRFEDLRNEMAGRAAVAGVLRDDGGGEA